jgi:hypothetical protein
MPKAIKLGKNKEFNFATSAAAVSKYPWDDWFNGQLLLLEQSEGTKDDKGTVTAITEKKDYEVATDAMPAKLKTAARRRYKVVQISRKDADGNRLQDSLIIRARDMTDEERQAEDLLRAEEKAELAARRTKAGNDGNAATDSTPAAEATAQS